MFDFSSLLLCLFIRLLVFGNIENGSLKEHLNGKNPRKLYYLHQNTNVY